MPPPCSCQCGGCGNSPPGEGVYGVGVALVSSLSPAPVWHSLSPLSDCQSMGAPTTAHTLTSQQGPCTNSPERERDRGRKRASE